jgi:hypothetical protein
MKSNRLKSEKVRSICTNAKVIDQSLTSNLKGGTFFLRFKTIAAGGAAELS